MARASTTGKKQSPNTRANALWKFNTTGAPLDGRPPQHDDWVIRPTETLARQYPPGQY